MLSRLQIATQLRNKINARYQLRLTHAQANDVVALIFENIVESLGDGLDVRIDGFGSFLFEARTKVKFKPAKRLKESANRVVILTEF
jgi:nucleoid DNA-binding protein